MNTGTTQLILELTGKCNMRCRYCIYHDGYPHNRAFTSKECHLIRRLNLLIT